MAQPKIAGFFSQRKKTTDIHPSKRRKLQPISETDSLTQNSSDSSESVEGPEPTSRPRRKCLMVSENLLAKVEQQAKPTTRGSRKSTRAKATTKPTLKGKSTSKDIRDVFRSQDEAQSSSGSEAEIASEITAACDDHVSSPTATPQKQISDTSSGNIPQKRGRKTVRKDLLEELNKTPEQQKGYDFTKFAEKSPQAKKRLILKGKSPQKGQEEDSLEAQLDKNANIAGKSKKMMNMKSRLSKLGKMEELHEKLAEYDALKSKTGKPRSGAASSQVKPSKLAQLHAQLAQTSKSVAKMKQQREKAATTVNEESSEPEAVEEKKQSVPAYKRFESLVMPVPPTLSLPSKYKLLTEMFNSAETVVGMLHKRNEICTFSKLKSAVETMMKKAFAEKNLGQIKTVYPTAYVLRQEKGLPSFGKKIAGYQMTVEPDLVNDLPGYAVAADTQQKFDKDGKPVFTASRMLQRKAAFHTSLIDIVKKHHESFLAKLARPLKVASQKITKWHPKFKVEEVPDIEPAELPAKPDVKVYNTAAEVLQQATSTTLNPRIKQALEKVADDEKNREKTKLGDASKVVNKTESISETKSAPSTSSPGTNVALKGVSSSLLERIRAKEATKVQNIMMRSPAEDKRREMIGRLPEICRIIRTVFVTQKKPALPFEDAIIRIRDSYKSFMGEADAEAHIKLMLEMVPEWVSLIHIRQGRYLKIDRNQDLNAIQSKLQKVIK